jgi:CheY-like chemotaxis protein
MLLAKQSDQNRWTASVQEIREAGRRASELTEQLLAFSRRSYTQRKVVFLDEVVAGAEKLLRRLIGEQVILTVQPGTKNRSIEADVNQLEQVLMNLAVNARDAMPNGGHLTITTNITPSPDSVIPRFHDEPGEFVQLDVTDTGVGMTDDIQSKVFEPFFTTKPTGKGSGLGLAVVHGIMQQNNGKIRIRSTPGHGTTFSMIFPVVDEAPTGEIQTINTNIRGGSETILFVEDEPGVRKFVRTVLELQGYKVLIASNGNEAIALAKLSQEPIHLLLTDVVMPGIDGHLVADSLRSDIPSLQVIYISGYAETEHIRESALNARETFLRKPFTPQELLAKVREHIDAGRTR